jgi:hypothetical protein
VAHNKNKESALRPHRVAVDEVMIVGQLAGQVIGGGLLEAGNRPPRQPDMERKMS